MEVVFPPDITHIIERGGGDLQPELAASGAVQKAQVQAESVIWKNAAAAQYYVPRYVFEDSGDLLLHKIVNIGAWNMQAVASVNIAHGLTLADIVSCSAIIIRNDSAKMVMFGAANAPAETTNHMIEIVALTVDLHRGGGGIFANVNYNNAVMNRGYILLTYRDC